MATDGPPQISTSSQPVPTPKGAPLARPLPMNRSLLHSPAAAQLFPHSLAEAKMALQCGPQSQPSSATQPSPSKIQPRGVAQSPKSTAPTSSQTPPPPVDVPVGSPVEVEVVPDVEVPVLDVEGSESVASELELPVALPLLEVEPVELVGVELVALSDVLLLSSAVQARQSPTRSEAEICKYGCRIGGHGYKVCREKYMFVCARAGDVARLSCVST